MIYLFDTSALIAHYRREAGWQQVQAIFDDEAAKILIASVTLTEFARRLRELGASDAEARQTAEDYRLLINDVVAVDEKIAFAAFDLARATPKRLPLVDALIAASARASGACLVHRDDHMTYIPENLLRQILLSAGSDIH
ncbi:type II toxin-antitoxin system VapC family toxin [Methylomagnum sp.]